MTQEQTLAVSLGLVSAIDDPYWLHMEIKKDPQQDGMSVAEAADMIDAAYNIKPCEPLETQQHDTWDQSDIGTNRDIWDGLTDNTSVDADTLAAQQRFVDSFSDYSTDCGKSGATIAELMRYDVTIKVFRSHRDELYKLQMSNGKASSAVKKSGRVVHTIDIKGQNSHTFDNPIIRTPVIAWQGIDGPDIHINGNTIYWDGYVDGTIRAEFYSEWDEVKITVTGEYAESEMITGASSVLMGTGWYSGSPDGSEIDDYQNIQCSVLAFYHYQYEELILDKPEKDKSTTEIDRANLCNFVTTVADNEDDTDVIDPDAKCWQHISETIICQCGSAPKQELDSRYEVVPCPAGVPDGTILRGSVDRGTTHKDCGYRDEANDPAVYEAHCCEEWPFEKAMPLCKEVISKLTGTKERDFLESDYPEGTNFIVVSPTDGLCGEHTIEQVLHTRQCCDGVTQIYWDYENSVEVLSPESSGVVFVTGGKSAYTWSVRGSGFSFAGGIRDALTDDPYIRVYMTSAACGPADLYVTDGCSSVSESLKSTNGNWDGGTFYYIFDHGVQLGWFSSVYELSILNCLPYKTNPLGLSDPYYADISAYRWDGIQWLLQNSEKGKFTALTYLRVKSDILASGAVFGKYPYEYLPAGPDVDNPPQCGDTSWIC